MRRLLPRPQLRADVINDRYPALVQFARQAQVEVGEVDEHRGVWASPFRLAHHLAEAAIDGRNVLDHLDDADLGDLARVHQELATGGAHLLAANAEELQRSARGVCCETWPRNASISFAP